MLDTIKTKPIKIEILDISPKNKAVLEFFFNNSGKSLFKKSNQDNADAFIIDYDFPGAKESWQKIYDATQKPGIVFSFKKVDLPHTISIAKPITAKTLADAGKALKELLALKKAEEAKNNNEEADQQEEKQATEALQHKQAGLAFAGSGDFAPEDTSIAAQVDEKPLADEKTLPENVQPSQTDSNHPNQTIEDVAFNSIDLDTLPSDENATEAKIDDTESSIESLLNELSADMPPVDELLADNTESETGLTTSNNAIPVVKEPVLTSNTPESATPHTMLEENDDTMISSDDEIEALLQSIQQRTDEKEEQPKSIAQKASNAKPVKPTRELTKAEKRWALLCGDMDDIADANDINDIRSGNNISQIKTKIRNISYNSKNHMLDYFLLAIKQAKRQHQVIEMKYPNHTMLIDHALNCVYCDSSIHSDSFAKFCSEPSNQADLTMRIIKDEDEIRQCRKIIGLALDTTYSIESFIWTASLLTSRGRLPQQFDITNIVKLTHWPDLTRVEQIPHAIRIAAVFYKHPGNLLEVAHWLHIPQRYVFAFYNAVQALDMVEIQKAEVSKTPEPSFFETEESTEKTKNRGLFSRLLTKLGAS